MYKHKKKKQKLIHVSFESLPKHCVAMKWMTKEASTSSSIY